jgi:hypothetical protein
MASEELRAIVVTAIVPLHSNPGICSVRLFVPKSRTETDARKEDSVIFVLMSRTTFNRNFVRFYVQQSGISVQRQCT